MSRTPEEHLAAVAAVVPEPSTEFVAVEHAAGRILAADLVAGYDSPRFDNSQMDGYALSADQIAATPGAFRVGPTVAAGTDPDTVYPQGVEDTIAPVMTGSKLPYGTAGVVPVEKCRPGEFPVEGTSLDVPRIAQGEFVRRTGADIQAGAPLIAAGRTITPAAVATLAGQSLREVEVYQRASIVIATGGAEIGAPGAASIPDANSPMLLALANRYGIDVAGRVETDDDPARLERDLRAAVAEHNPTAVVTSGGISHGKFEVVRQVLAREGWFGHVDQQPGGPQGLSQLADTPVICLPGNPISTLVSFRLFVAPTLGTVPETVTAQLAAPRRGLGDGREQLLRGKISADDDGVLRAETVGGTGSHLIAQAVEANALIRIPADANLAAGDAVTVYPL